MTPLQKTGFSVIIPVYNGEAIVAGAIESIQQQDYTNLEIIAVDDGSTDGSWQLLQRLAKTEPRLRCFQIPNSGQPAPPRNHGLQQAKGAFISFLDQDDRWRPARLSQHIAKFKEDDFAVVYSDALVHDGRPKGSDFLYSSHMRVMPEGGVVTELLYENFISMLTASVRREWLDKVGPINETVPGIDDYELWLRVAMSGGRFGYINEPLTDYYLSDTNLSHQQEMMETSLVRTYIGITKLYPNYAAQAQPRLQWARGNLCNFYISQLQQRRGSRSDRIRTARQAYACSITFRQKLRIARWLTQAIV